MSEGGFTEFFKSPGWELWQGRVFQEPDLLVEDA